MLHARARRAAILKSEGTRGVEHHHVIFLFSLQELTACANSASDTLYLLGAVAASNSRIGRRVKLVKLG